MTNVLPIHSYLRPHSPSSLSRLTQRVRLVGVRYAAGILSLKWQGTPSPHDGAPLQWVLLQAPGLSSLQWHPFSVSWVSDAADESYAVCIRVVEGGWTSALRDMLAGVGSVPSSDGGGAVTRAERGPPRSDGHVGWRAPAEGSAAPRVNISCFHGLPFDIEPYLNGQQSLLLICGGSGGTPFAALVQQLSRLSAHARGDAAPILLVWASRTKEELQEYVRATELAAAARRCHSLSIRLHVTSAAPREETDVEPALREAEASGESTDAASEGIELCPASSRASSRVAVMSRARRSFSRAGALSQRVKLLPFGNVSSSTRIGAASAAATVGADSPRISSPPPCSTLRHQAALKCHVLVPAGTLIAMACAERARPAESPWLLFALLVGAAVGGVLAYGWQWLSSTRRHRRRRTALMDSGSSMALPSTSNVLSTTAEPSVDAAPTNAPMNAPTNAPMDAPTDAPLRPVRESAASEGIGALETIELSCDGDDAGGRVTWHKGRPRISELLSNFEAPPGANVAMLASGPKELVRAAERCAKQCDIAFEAVSFVL